MRADSSVQKGLNQTGQRFIEPVELRAGDFVRRFAQNAPLAGRVRLHPVTGQPVRLVGGEARIGFYQAAGDGFAAGVGFQGDVAALQAFELVHPLCVAAWRLRRLAGGQAKAFEIDQSADARWPKPRQSGAIKVRPAIKASEKASTTNWSS